MPSWLLSTFACSARSTCSPPELRAVMSAENGTLSADEIFQSTLMVGALWPSSIWPSIARETPDSLESFSSDRSRWLRSRRRLPPTTGVRSLPAGATSPGSGRARGSAEGAAGRRPRFDVSRAVFMIPTFSVTTEALSTRSTSAAGPWRLTLVTDPDDCNLACAMCPCGAARAGGGPRPPPRRMAPALALAVLEERRGSPLRELIPSTLGEPLLWPALPELLARAAAQGVRGSVVTNGTFPGRGAAAWAEVLVPTCRDVKISWNGATARTAAAVMPGLDLEAAIEGVRALVAARERHAAAGGARCSVSFQVTAREDNAAELAGIVRLAARLGVDRVKLNHLQVRSPDLAPLSLRRSPAAIRRWNAAVREVRAAAAEAGERAPALENAVELAPDPADPAPRGPCPFAGREAWIHPDGRLAPCPHPDAAAGGLGDFGTVAEAPLGALWAAPALQAFVAPGPGGHPVHPVCDGCALRRPGGA